MAVGRERARKSRYENSLAGRMLVAYESLIEDKAEILNSSDEIALLLAKIQITVDLDQQLPLVSERVFRAYDDFLIARAAGNVHKLQQAFGGLDVAMSEAKELYYASRDFLPLIEALRKTRETEQKRRLAMRQMLTIEDARKFFRTIQGIVLECTTLISDDVERQKVKTHFANRVEQAFQINQGRVTEEDLRRDERTWQ